MNPRSRRFARLSAPLATAAAALLLSNPAAAQTKLLRYPDVHGGRVAFCYGGDIWTASATGGLAARVTAHPGQELFPKFSPDGKWIAFTGQYEGDEQVYVVPAEGGVPKRLTWYPARGPLPPRGGMDNQVYGWTPDGAKVLFRSLRDAESAKVESALYTVPVAGGLPVEAPDVHGGRRGLQPRRDEARLLAALPRLPHLEALRGGLGAGPLRLRPRDRDLEGHRSLEADRARPDVDRREDLLRLRPRRHAEPLLRRPLRRGPREADAVDDVGREVGQLGLRRAASSTSSAASCASTT